MVTGTVLKRGTRKFGRPTVGVGFDMSGALRVERELGLLADRLPWLQERAIRTLYRRLPVEARRDIQRQYNIIGARIREHMAVRYIDSGPRLGGIRLYGQWARGIGMANFRGTRQVRAGVSYSVYHGIRKVDKGSFMARLLQGRGRLGNLHAVERYGPKVTMQAGRYKGLKRQRLAVHYRSTVAQMLAEGRRPERLADYSRRILQQEVERQLASYMRRPSAP